MLNLNKVGRPLAKIEGGTYNGMIVSVSDHLASNADDDKDQGRLIEEFRQLNIANDSKFQRIPDTTNEREILYIGGGPWIREEHLHPQVSQAVCEEVQEQTHLFIF